MFSRYALKSHMVMHSDERPHKCDLCGKTFARRDSLKLHGYSHKTEKPFICTYCGKAFVSKYRLHAHTLRHEKKFPCNVCGKSYFANWALRKHMQLHTGDAPHVCDECGKQFTRRGYLVTHLLTHGGEKTHECEECGRMFLRKDTLEKHRIVHTDDKPYQCEICWRAFRVKSTLTQHHLMVHTKDPEKHQCTMCDKGFIKRVTCAGTWSRTARVTGRCAPCAVKASPENTRWTSTCGFTPERNHIHATSVVNHSLLSITGRNTGGCYTGSGSRSMLNHPQSSVNNVASPSTKKPKSKAAWQGFPSSRIKWLDDVILWHGIVNFFFFCLQKRSQFHQESLEFSIQALNIR